jgi:hypothetical protein
MDPLKPKQVRIYVDGERRALFDELVGKSGLPETGLMTMLVASALDAVRDNGGRISLPMELRVAGGLSDGYRLKEETPAKARK